MNMLLGGRRNKVRKPIIGVFLLTIVFGLLIFYAFPNLLDRQPTMMQASANESINQHPLEKQPIELFVDFDDSNDHQSHDESDDDTVISESENHEVDESISDEQLVEQLFSIMNEERQLQNIKEFDQLSQLNEAAEQKSADMRDYGYFDMESPNFGSASDIIKSYDIPYYSLAASLSAGVQDPKRVFEQLNDGNFTTYLYDRDFTHVGIGYVSGGQYGHYWTIYFIDHPIEQDPNEMEQLVFEIVNEIRDENGLSRLAQHERLAEVARIKSEDMRDQNYVAHESPTYGAPYEMIDHYEIENNGSAENIAAGQKTAEEVVGGWMNSDGHRANILNENVTHLGVGYAQGGEQNSYWTQLFIIE